MARTPKSVSRAKEQRAVAMHLAGHKFDDIAQELGYANRSGAYDCVMRALKRDTMQDIDEIRVTELARLDDLLLTTWEKAKEGDLQAIDRVLRLMERRARYMGLDFSDGIAERQVAINAQLAGQLGAVLGAFLQRIAPPPELKSHYEAVMREVMLEIPREIEA